MEAAAVVGADGVLGDAEAVGELYADRAERVRRLVRAGVHAPEPVIEDACQFAWIRLLHNRPRVRNDTAQAWLVATAVHEAYKLLRRQHRDVSLDGLLELGGGEIAPPGATTALEDLVAQRARLEAIRALPERQQRLVWLQTLGLSYAEIAAQTGDSMRTVERQLLRAKRLLAREEAAE
ncbi:MAG: sigma-70 family RNA polymerase sigma factor [Solirubrobacteraceae bacterium]